MNNNELPKQPGLARRLAYGELIRQGNITNFRSQMYRFQRYINNIITNDEPAPDEDFILEYEHNVSTSTLTYEQLITLEDVKTGLKIRDINCNSKVYIKDKHIHINICTICQEVFNKPGEIIRELNCGHPYHINCIDKWFEDNVFCPICKFNLTNKNI